MIVKEVKSVSGGFSAWAGKRQHDQFYGIVIQQEECHPTPFTGKKISESISAVNFLSICHRALKLPANFRAVRIYNAQISAVIKMFGEYFSVVGGFSEPGEFREPFLNDLLRLHLQQRLLTTRLPRGLHLQGFHWLSPCGPRRSQTSADYYHSFLW